MPEAPPIWLDRTRFAVNREPGRAQLPSDGDRIRLDGEWQFSWVEGLSGFDSADVAGGPLPGDPRPLPVPSVWQLHGYGIPYYLANTYPPAVKRRNIPDIPAESNEAGVYRRSIIQPAPWASDPRFGPGSRRCLLFEGAKAGLEVFLNGRFLGYSQGSFLPAEFEVTDLLMPGDNELTVVVYRYTDGTYLEDQDMWFLSGLFRSVWLIAEPAVAIKDVFVHGEVAPDLGSAAARIEVRLANHTEAPVSLNITAAISPTAPSFLIGPTPGPDVVASPPATTESTVTVPPGAEAAAALTVPIESPQLWSAEHPHRYGVTVTATSDTSPGPPLDTRHLTTGFRRLEIRDGQLLINNQRLIFKGVNRHDFDPDSGWAVPEWRYRADLLEAKRLNINAIRTSHYPNPQLLYDIADEIGLYVMDECDLETHGVRRRNVPGDDPAWTAQCVDRMQRMVLADRNHPAIVMWSLGNEAGLGGRDGGNFAKMKQAALGLDTTRPFHYEGDHNPLISDVVSRMYATPDQMAALGRGEPLIAGLRSRLVNRTGITDDKDLTPEIVAGRPVMLCEYAHSMENSLGNLDEYLDVFYRYPNQLGGFIWDYIDQSIRRVGPLGGTQWLYGGDFNDHPNHGYFCANGILAADRTRHPAAQEVFWAYRNLVVTADDATTGALTLDNRKLFTNADAFEATIELRVEGELFATLWPTVPAIAPGDSQPWLVPELGVAIADATASAEAGADQMEIAIRCSFTDPHPRPWHPAGTEVAFDEFVARIPIAPMEVPTPTPPPAAATTTTLTTPPRGSAIEAAVGIGSVVVDPHNGELRSWHVAGHEVLDAPIRTNTWRALTDNDRGVIANIVPRSRRLLIDTSWRDPATRVRRVREVHSEHGWSLTLALSGRLWEDNELRYSLDGQGGLSVHHTVVPRKDMIRFGITLAHRGVERVTWYGKGPHENYIDRQRGAWTAIHELPLAELGHHYMRPQENGNRTGARWVRFTSPDGALTATDTSGDTIGFTAWPHSQEQLDAAEHITDLRPSELTTINLDHRQRGVGGDLPGDAALHEPYRLPKGVRQTLSIRLKWQPFA